MKRRMIVAGLCVGVWLCGTIHGQTVVTNLTVLDSVVQGSSSVADGVQASAFGESTMAYGDYSLAEGVMTEASGVASHAEGDSSLAGGDRSHAQGLATSASAVNSHAGGAFAEVRALDSNAFIHATGTSVTNMKQTLYPDTAHFDHIVTLESAWDANNAILSRAENDSRYLQNGSAITVTAIHVIGNSADGAGAVVAGGSNNTAGINAFVGSGVGNGATNRLSAVVAGNYNQASGVAAFIGGGGDNIASGTSSFVGAGGANRAAGYYGSFVGAGAGNTNNADYASIVAGRFNFVSNYAAYGSIVGGYSNAIMDRGYSFIGGGYGNSIDSTSSGPASTKYAFIGAGGNNKAWAPYAMIPGGYGNVVTGKYGFAAGYYAAVVHQGAFVWSDSSAAGPFTTTSSNQFLVRAMGGVGINTNVTTGKALTVAGDVEVAGAGRFTAGLRVPQQGDISMGTYTNGTF